MTCFRRLSHRRSSACHHYRPFCRRWRHHCSYCRLVHTLDQVRFFPEALQWVTERKNPKHKNLPTLPPPPPFPPPPPPLLLPIPSSSPPPPRILDLYSRYCICINNTTISPGYTAPVCVMKFDFLIIDEREIATCICKDGEIEIATKEIKKK